MNELKTGVENPCFEVQMESKPTNDAGIYLEVVNGEAPAKQQTSLEYQGPATKKNPLSPIDPAHSDKFLKLRQMLWIVTAVAFISLLTSAATLILALKVKNSQNVSTSPTIVKHEHTLETKLQDLEKMLNSTRQVAEEASWKHLTALWSAENNTKKEIDKVWTAMNETGKQLDEKLMKIRHNLTGQINNVGKIAGPVGPPGFNGSQGPAGPAGSPGPKGAGDFSTCRYKVKTEAAGGDQMAYVDEPTGHIIIAATCSTNYNENVEFRSAIVVPQKRRYICDCKGVKYSRPNPKNCSLHYWICSKT